MPLNAATPDNLWTGSSPALVRAGVGDAALLRVGPLLPRLHTLRLECCPNLTDAGLAVRY